MFLSRRQSPEKDLLAGTFQTRARSRNPLNISCLAVLTKTEEQKGRENTWLCGSCMWGSNE